MAPRHFLAAQGTSRRERRSGWGLRNVRSQGVTRRPPGCESAPSHVPAGGEQSGGERHKTEEIAGFRRETRGIAMSVWEASGQTSGQTSELMNHSPYVLLL